MTVKRRLVSLLCVLAMLCGLASAVPTASAATVIPTLEAGDTWNGQWAATQTENYLDLRVEETGFYTLTVTDHMQTGYVMVTIYDSTDMAYLGQVFEWGGDTPYVSEPLYLCADHGYSLELLYGDIIDTLEYQAADMTITFERADVVPTQLPNVAASGSNVMTSLEAGEHEWFRFTTTAAGDYTVDFSEAIGAYVTVYEAATGKWIDERDTQYYRHDLWWNGNKAVFRLKANREYYVQVYNYDSAVTTRVSAIKNEYTVAYITADSPSEFRLGPWDRATEAETCLNYKVHYENGTPRVVSYDTLCTWGVKMPQVYFGGDEMYVNGEWLLAAGERPVTAEHNGVTSHSTVTVTSVTDWLATVAEPVGEYDRCRLVNNGVDDDFGYYRIKVEKTGVYEVYAKSADWDKLDVSFAFLDAQNRPVQYYGNGYPLVAGQEYALSVRYTFADDAEEFVFWPQMEQQTMFPDTGAGAWYSDAVAYAVGRGIMTGYKSGLFGTSDGIQRQDFLVMLARMDGVDLTDYVDQHGHFPDVAKNSYYEAAVMWGYENGIVTGYNNGRFGVGDKITREQLVTFLQRYAVYKGYDVSYSSTTATLIGMTYTDYKNVTAFAKDAVTWALDNGVIKGKTATTIVPQGTAQRCEVAQMMYNIFLNGVL